MQPAFSSDTVMPTSFMNPPSMPISPYSFSSSTTFSFFRLPVSSFRISVVFPAPRKPEITLILTISVPSFLCPLRRFLRRFPLSGDAFIRWKSRRSFRRLPYITPTFSLCQSFCVHFHKLFTGLIHVHSTSEPSFLIVPARTAVPPAGRPAPRARSGTGHPPWRGTAGSPPWPPSGGYPAPRWSAGA